MNGPNETKWEDQKIWDEESRLDHDPEGLTREDIYDLKCDEKFEKDR